MGVDLHGSDPTAAESGAHIDELVEYARGRLALGPDQPWVLVGSRRKLTKTFFEVDHNGLRIIGKASKSDRSGATYDILLRLREAGLRPPSPYRVPRPIAWFPERRLLLQEKAQGKQLLELIRTQSPEALPGVERAAMWLHCLQRLELPAEAASDQTLALDRIRDELSAALPGDAATVTRLLASCEAAFERCEPAVPSHGDFHPMNIFVGEDDSVTAIDVDTFAHRHASFDVAYFAAQTAIMGHHVFESFEATRALRERFLEAAPRADAECLHLWTAFALLRSLHYDLCILKLENKAQVAPFLRAAEFGLDA